jgi:multiple sugar transport system substrate-binding protein
MKKVYTTLLAVTLMLTTAGCGAGSQTAGTDPKPKETTASKETAKSNDPVKLRIAWWSGTQARNEYTIKVVEMYEKAHPNVKFEYEYGSYDDYWKKMAPQAAANQMPDILQMDISYLSQYGLKDQLEDLTPYTKNGNIDISSISENTIAGGKLNDKLYGFNIGINAISLTADAAILEKAGLKVPQEWTWDDYESMAMKLKEKGYIMSSKLVPEQFFALYLRENGQHLYSNDGSTLGYTDDKLFVDYFSRLQRITAAKAMQSPDEADQVKSTEDGPLAKGKAAFSWGFSNQYIGEQAAAKRPLEIAPPPGPNVKQGLYLKPSMYFSIAKSSKQKEEAAKFIDFFVNDIEANKLIKADRGVPVSSKIKEALKPDLTPELTKVFDYVAWAEKNSSVGDPPDPIGSAEVTKLLRDFNDQIMYKKAAPEEAATKFRKQAGDILAKNKK